MFVKIHKAYRDVVAICDSDLIGKKFEQDNLQLEIKETFYKGEDKKQEEIIKILEQMSEKDATFNIVGENSVEVALKCGIITNDNIKTIQQVPFALVLA